MRHANFIKFEKHMNEMNEMRNTKIVCTIGPATDSPEVIEELIKAGMDIARLNLSFGDLNYHRRMIDIIRDVSEKVGKCVAILLDLPGPKIRVGKLPAPLTLHRGDMVIFTQKRQENIKAIPVSHPEILQNLEKGDIIYLADGSIRLKVVDVGDDVKAEVLEGGILASYKGINFPSISRKITSITEKDRESLSLALERDIEWVALSFVRGRDDVERLKHILKDRRIPVIAKIEKREAVTNLEAILEVADGIMVARGDLGVELPLEEVPVVQKMAIKMANRMGKPVITATQMLKSMVLQSRPTRAEVTDVANAVLDGSDAVMLSEETATGRYPVEAVKMMDRIIRKTETMYPYLQDYHATSVTESIARSATRISGELKADAILTFTRTGTSAIQLSRYRPPAPVLVATHDEKTLRMLSLIWGCIPLLSVSPESSFDEVVYEIVQEGMKKGTLREGGLIVVTSGFPFGEPGTTNTIKVLRVRDVIDGLVRD